MGDDDVLWEIFARLPPQPSFLLRASLVCQRWRRLATDHDFLRRRWPPIIGVFIPNHYTKPPSFKCILDPPDSIPPERFALRYESEAGYEDDDIWYFLGCRHGCLLLLLCSRADPSYRLVLVWDPVIEEQRFLYLPPHFDNHVSPSVQGAVLCASADERHVHGDCHSSPFKVVLACADIHNARALACVYSSETDSWGDLITSSVRDPVHHRLSDHPGREFRLLVPFRHPDWHR
ncbi:uncharacterized protein LOC100842030 [Brachypodium distachyon]|uniref:uncharacterized protein LOC100842030 n=1 Tax=Brachypodium distachyon TaxID=15368 RepID=UPI0001D43403|nr:uncharacterized protein LOC100842030 [Brachypodium distachyon]|eukprot:XP_024314955.1 uncharacterized protein LOC100842030 [Brachypodium distachyon]